MYLLYVQNNKIAAFSKIQKTMQVNTMVYLQVINEAPRHKTTRGKHID